MKQYMLLISKLYTYKKRGLVQKLIYHAGCVLYGHDNHKDNTLETCYIQNRIIVIKVINFEPTINLLGGPGWLNELGSWII